MKMMLLMLGVLMVWDFLSTMYVLKRGGTELNPWLAKLFAKYPDHREEILLGLKVVAMGVIVTLASMGMVHEFAMYLILVVYALIGLNNLKVILRMRGR